MRGFLPDVHEGKLLIVEQKDELEKIVEWLPVIKRIKGNVDIICERYRIKQVNTLEDARHYIAVRRAFLVTNPTKI